MVKDNAIKDAVNKILPYYDQIILLKEHYN